MERMPGRNRAEGEVNMREAFEACFYKREGHPPSQMNIADIAAWQGFQMGAAFAARECAEIAKDRQYNLMPDERAHDAIREAFPEAFK